MVDEVWLSINDGVHIKRKAFALVENTKKRNFNNTLVTLTIDNVPEGKKAVVTIGDSEEAVNLTDNTYTFTVTADITLNISVEDIGAGGEGKVSTTVSKDFSAAGYSNQQKIENISLDNNITITLSKGSGSTAPAYYDTGTGIRIYAKGTMTITSLEGYVIKSIKLTFGSGDKSNAITSDVGTWATDTWTGESSIVVLTVGGSRDHRRIKAIEIVYEES